MRRIGKYRLQRRLGEGGFAEVFQAIDTVEGTPVALKVPHPQFVSRATLDAFRREMRLTASLDHANVLPLKNAEVINGTLVVAYPLGVESLADRLRRRLAVTTGLSIAEQILAALAYAHGRRIIHCDVKPENFILFPDHRVRLADFGIARVALRTLSASGSGTVGYLAPEQALGKPSPRSDVFSAGLVLWQMFGGAVPEWPFQPPFVGESRVRRKLGPEFVAFLGRALQVDDRRRPADAGAMLAAFQRLAPAIRRFRNGERPRRKQDGLVAPAAWPLQRVREFRRRYRGKLRLGHSCDKCHGPLSAAMPVCPWCGTKRERHRGAVAYPARCGRCGRGRKRDWRFCAWCYGAGFTDVAERSYSDRRYAAQCSHAGCRGPLVPFSRYCPWCRRKVRRKWELPGSRDRCGRCGWGVARAYWDHCAWCGTTM